MTVRPPLCAAVAKIASCSSAGDVLATVYDL
jgi:hypothetical protein